MRGTSSSPSGNSYRPHRAGRPRRRRPRCHRRARGAAPRRSQTGRCVRTAGARETRLDVFSSRASTLALHDFHEAVRIEDLELSVCERHPEFIPGDDFDPVVPTFRELNPIRSLDATRPETFLLCLLDGLLDSHGLHDHPIPPGRGPTRARLQSGRRYLMVVSGRRGPLARRLSIVPAVSRLVPRFGSSGIRGLGNIDVTAELALHVGMILGEIYGSTIVGRDPRVTGPMLVQALTAGVLSSGAPAIDAGLVSTPTITPFLLRQMGCDVIAINAQADGHFPGRDPEPLEENLAVLSSTVRAVHADLGIAHDGDGDRMVAVDREGRFVGGDTLLALF